MSNRRFHPKAVVYALYTVLFVSNAFTAAIMLPMISIFAGGSSAVNLLAGFLPFLVGFLISEFLEANKLLRSAVIGNLIIGVTTLLAAITNRFMVNQLREFVDAFSQTNGGGHPAIIANLDSAGAELVPVFLVAALSFNAPIFYRYIQDRRDSQSST